MCFSTRSLAVILLLILAPPASAEALIGPVRLTFQNASPNPVRVLWVDFKGKEREYKRLQPGASYVQSTYTGHKWIVREQKGGRVLLRFTADRTRAVIIPEGPRLVRGKLRQLNEDTLAGAAYTTAGNPQSWLKPVANNWMSLIEDSALLSAISIPGTHDSGARFGGLAAETQSWTIREQLDAGVRFLDIRCRQTGDSFAIHHGPFFQKQMFGDVMNAIVGFLSANPTEAVVMRWKTNEHTAQKGSSSARTISDSYIARYRRYFYQGDGTIPQLGSVRGKILILRNGSIDPKYGMSWGGSADIQDYYKVFWFAHKQTKDGNWATLPSKKQLVRSYLDRAGTSSKWVFNHLSGAVGMAPKDVARSTNGNAYDHIGIYKKQKKLGTVIMDYPGDRLVYRIIKSNFNMKPDGWVNCFCQAGYVARFVLSYTVDGKAFRQTKKLSAGFQHRFTIPGNATGISVTGQWSFGGWKKIFTKRYSRPPNRTLKVYGTIFSRQWKEQ